MTGPAFGSVPVRYLVASQLRLFNAITAQYRFDAA